jgi:hypothetical protein
MNPLNRNDFLFVFTIILLLTIFGVFMVNMCEINTVLQNDLWTGCIIDCSYNCHNAKLTENIIIISRIKYLSIFTFFSMSLGRASIRMGGETPVKALNHV